jgi:hypothetical protein
MSSEKYMDAGKKMEVPTLADAPTKVYPRFTVDLDQFPGLECDMDENVDINLRGRVCGLNHNEWRYDMEIEVTSIAIPSHTNEHIGPKNEADLALGKLKSGRSY